MSPPEPAVRKLSWLSGRYAPGLLGLAGVFLLAGLPGLAGEIGQGALGVAEVVFVLLSLGWGLFHPRVVTPAFGSAVRWAFWMALAASIGTASLGPPLARQAFGAEPPSWMVLGLSVAAFFLGFACAWCGGILFASMGGWVARRRPDPWLGARAAVSLGWAGVVLLLLAASVRGVPGVISEALALAIVPGVAWLSLNFDPESLGITRWLTGALLSIGRRLLRPREGRPPRDLRGVVLGGMGGLLALLLAVGPMPALGPLQNQALEGLMRLRNEPLGFDVEPEAGSPVAWRKRFVVVTMDPVTRRQVSGEGSETKLLAQAVERLAPYRPLAVVVPVPDLDASWQEGPSPDLDAPPSDDRAIARNRAELPRLEAALRRTPAAVLALPDLSGAPDPAVKAALAGLLQAAPVGAFASVGWQGTTRVAAVQLQPISNPVTEPLPPVPLALLAVQRGQRQLAIDRRPGEVVAAGVHVPVVGQDRMLVDFGGTHLSHNLPHLSYHALLAGGPVYVPDHRMKMVPTPPYSQQWKPAEYFAGKVVVLEGAGEAERETAVGRIRAADLLAHASATALSGEFIAPEHPVLSGLFVVALGMIVGASCAGVTPLAAGWRLGFALLLPLVAAPLRITFGAWLDPVGPLFAGIISFALVTQLSYRHEQGERQRERDLLERVAAPEVVDELLARPDQLALGGERRQVCILFADIRGFTPFAESRTAEEVITVINRYTTALADALLAHGGILDRYTGDGLIARFEIFQSPEADVCRAVGAALAMRDASESVAASLVAEGEAPLRVGMGVHFGEAVVGLVGSPAQFHYTAMGHTVVVAARLQGIAAGGEVLVTQEVHRLVCGEYDCEPRGAVTVKGISEAIDTYCVLERADKAQLLTP